MAIVFAILALVLIAVASEGGSGGSIQVLSDDMDRIINDPRNKTAMDDLMTKSDLTLWQIHIDEDGLITILPKP
jgi:hypothetical protein